MKTLVATSVEFLGRSTYYNFSSSSNWTNKNKKYRRKKNPLFSIQSATERNGKKKIPLYYNISIQFFDKRKEKKKEV